MLGVGSAKGCRHVTRAATEEVLLQAQVKALLTQEQRMENTGKLKLNF
jgi:hypothetical protein